MNYLNMSQYTTPKIHNYLCSIRLLPNGMYSFPLNKSFGVFDILDNQLRIQLSRTIIDKVGGYNGYSAY